MYALSTEKFVQCSENVYIGHLRMATEALRRICYSLKLEGVAFRNFCRWLILFCWFFVDFSPVLDSIIEVFCFSMNVGFFKCIIKQEDVGYVMKMNICMISSLNIKFSLELIRIMFIFHSILLPNSLEIFS